MIWTSSVVPIFSFDEESMKSSCCKVFSSMVSYPNYPSFSNRVSQSQRLLHKTSTNISFDIVFENTQDYSCKIIFTHISHSYFLLGAGWPTPPWQTPNPEKMFSMVQLKWNQIKNVQYLGGHICMDTQYFLLNQ